jgi:hypothetical protein
VREIPSFAPDASHCSRGTRIKSAILGPVAHRTEQDTAEERREYKHNTEFLAIVVPFRDHAQVQQCCNDSIDEQQPQGRCVISLVPKRSSTSL